MAGVLACAPKPDAETSAKRPAKAGEGPDSVTPQVLEVPVLEAPERGDGRPVGRWKSDTLCLETFANGDFELSIMNPRSAKALVMGAARVVATEQVSVTMELEVRRIWHARWTGKCRKEHEFGGFVDQERALGLTFEKGKPVNLKLTVIGDDELEVCGQSCVTLQREIPNLGGRWRIAGLEYPNNPKAIWKKGDMLELDIDESSGHLWVGIEPKKIGTVYGGVDVESLGADEFSLSFTPDGTMDDDAGREPQLWGNVLRKNDFAGFSARRLADQRLEVCDVSEHCATLERQFESDSHDLH
jgi:hypothetical protein